MMNYDFLLAFVGDHTPEIASALYVTGIALLVSSLWTRGRAERTQREALADCQVELADAALVCGELRHEVEKLRATCDQLRDRQAQLERRAPDARRFDHAVRIIRQGATDADVLSDLGINDGEARLLMRLHASDDGDAAEVVPPAPQSKQGRALAEVMGA